MKNMKSFFQKGCRCIAIISWSLLLIISCVEIIPEWRNLVLKISQVWGIYSFLGIIGYIVILIFSPIIGWKDKINAFLDQHGIPVMKQGPY